MTSCDDRFKYVQVKAIIPAKFVGRKLTPFYAYQKIQMTDKVQHLQFGFG